MKMIFQAPALLVAILVTLLIVSPLAQAATSDGGNTAVVVCTDVYSADDLENLFDEFNQLMDWYVREVSLEKKKQILQKAKNIFKQLMDQADSVEAEVSKKSRKNLHKAYARQLDIVLKRVQTVRKIARQRMDSASKAG